MMSLDWVVSKDGFSGDESFGISISGGLSVCV